MSWVDVLREPAWTFISVVVTLVVGVPFAYWLVKRQQKKEISCEFLNAELVTVDKRISDNRLQITFDGKSVNRLHLVLLRMSNCGSTPINPQDFQGNVEISFGENSQVLRTEIVKKVPQGLQMSFEDLGTKVDLKPTLLNQKETFDMKFLVSNFKEVIINGRISGVRITVKKTPKSPPFVLPVTIGGMAMAFIGFLLASNNPDSIPITVLSVSGMLFMLVPAFYLIFASGKNKFDYLKRV
jgi:hypothetical protein